MQSEVFEAVRDIGGAEDKALKAAGMLSRRDDDVTAMKSDVNPMKWMLGVGLALQITQFVKMFVHERSIFMPPLRPPDTLHIAALCVADLITPPWRGGGAGDG